MCDTMAVVQQGQVLFAKNSDRDPNEAQYLDWHPRRQFPAGATVQCTHIPIPQVPETYAVLLSRPFWIWGAEMGTNEFGVTIGNEAVFTREPIETKGLLGMDLLRLALERADTARAACDVITSLLEAHGQGGGAGHEHRNFSYHNSFIVADPREAYVLETAGRKWAIEPIHGVRSISNGLTIPDFAQKHSDRLRSTVAACKLRRRRTQGLLTLESGVGDLMRVLQDHGEGRDEPRYKLINGGLTVPCVHGGGLIASSQTTASWVSKLSPVGCQHWATGTAAPCTSLFKPVSVDVPIDTGKPSDRADQSLWWRHERFHRRVLRAPLSYRRFFDAERTAVQHAWIDAPPASEDAFAQGDELLATWIGATQSVAAADQRPWFVRRYWQARDRRAGL